MLPTHAPLVSANPHVVLRAIVAQEARDLDMALWNRAIEAREEALQLGDVAGAAAEPSSDKRQDSD